MMRYWEFASTVIYPVVILETVEVPKGRGFKTLFWIKMLNGQKLSKLPQKTLIEAVLR